MPDFAIDLLGAVALVVTASTVVPQLLRLVREASVAGVSPSWTALGTVSTGVWTIYLVQGRLWWPAVADAMCCLSYATTWRLLGRRGVDLRLSLVVATSWLTAFVVAHLGGGRGAVGTVLGLSFVVQVSPSVWSAYRTPRPVGASTVTWLLVGLEGGLWGAYGFLLHDRAVLVFGAVAFGASILMVPRLVLTRRGSAVDVRSALNR